MITKERMGKFMSSANGVYSEKTPIVGTPLDLHEDVDAWELDKDGLLTVVNPKSLKRPIFVRDGNVYKLYFKISGVWCFCADSKAQNTLGNHIRFITRYEHRKLGDFLKQLKAYECTPKDDMMCVLKMNKILNKLGYHVQQGCSEMGNVQAGNYRNIFKKYLKYIAASQALLLDNGIKVNHDTISWGGYTAGNYELRDYQKALVDEVKKNVRAIRI